MKRFIFFLLISASFLRGDFIAADFETNKGDFTVELWYARAPLAVANFIQLAGKDDDILETATGVPWLETADHFRFPYSATSESDAARLPMTVRLIPATPTMRAFYAIFQSATYIGGVETFQLRGYYADITGEDRIRLSLIDPRNSRYRITLRYPRNWLDARDQRVREAPMYRNLRVRKVESGRRFFAGTMTGSPNELPGYSFQDEIWRIPNSNFIPNRVPFNSPFILAMDNVGKNRNGSRFFITTVAETLWNQRYTAIGSVVSGAGRSVVLGIVNTPTDQDGLPDEAIVIEKITTRRSGLTANAFLETFHQTFLPGEMAQVPVSIERAGDALDLRLPLRPGSQTNIYRSSDLINYEFAVGVSQNPGSDEAPRVDLTSLVSLAPRQFFRAVSVPLPDWPSADLELANARFSLEPNTGVNRGGLNLFFNADGETGAYQIDMIVERRIAGQDSELVRYLGTGAFAATYQSDQGPFVGTLTFSNVSGLLNTERLTLHFDSTNPNAEPAAIIRRFDSTTLDPAIPRVSYSGIFSKTQ